MKLILFRRFSSSMSMLLRRQCLSLTQLSFPSFFLLTLVS